MRIDLIVWLCVLGLLAMIVLLGGAFLIGYKKGVQDMVSFHKVVYEMTKGREENE